MGQWGNGAMRQWGNWPIQSFLAAAPAEIARILRACRERYTLTPDAEITLETNPETATPGRLAAFREAGVTRLSFGVQSFDDDELKKLGRIHTAEKAIDVIGEAMRIGFASVSFDLMLWLPGQTPESWYRTVDRAISAGPRSRRTRGPTSSR